jgi:tRNA(fMet)-specific endonuclease VapC
VGDVAAGLLIADTDLVIDFLRGSGAGADLIESSLRSGVLRFTAVTAFELRLGSDLLRRRRLVEAMLKRRTLPLDLGSALLAGEIFTRLERDGDRIGVQDVLIAGICQRYGLPLATRNVDHFRRVRGLRLMEVKS